MDTRKVIDKNIKDRKLVGLDYINTDYQYVITTSAWQMIRPSYLVFLNCRIPVAETPWSEGGIIQAAEVGTAGGINSAIILKAYSKVFLHLVDSYEYGQSPEAMLKSVEPYKERTKFHHMTSLEGAKQYPDEFFDYVYIDAAHDYKSVSEDMEAWYPKVKYGGMLSGHDWYDKEVRDAVYNFVTKNPQRLYGVQSYFQEGKPTPFTHEENMGVDWWFVKRMLEKK